MSSNCLFCKISSGEIPSQKIYEDEHVFGFVDIHPQAKIHLLFLHKKHTANINEMSTDPKAIAQMFHGIAEYSKSCDLATNGFRVVTNLGADGGQSVFHTHFHILGGEPLGHFGRR
ncbi:MAG: HIT domain-containing protein [Bacteriovorax sp.]|nr:HIT domain-containing protein [Bacteriovorax sp.]